MPMSRPDRPLRVAVVGCTPLAAKVIDLIDELAELVGVVGLHPLLGVDKSNYDGLFAFARRSPGDLLHTTDINAAETITWLAARRPDVLIQCGWSQIFGPDVLAVPRLMCVGVHPSPLPTGRGAAVINWRLLEGGGPWGNTLFVMQRGVDTGPILDFEPFELEPRDDARTAYLKVDRSALKMLRRTIPRLARGDLSTRPQPGPASRYPRRSPEDGRMEWDWPVEQVLRTVRALTHPFPGAFFETRLGRLIVWQASGHHVEPMNQARGSIAEVRPGRGISVAVGDGAAWLELVTPPGDVECWADEWAGEAGLAVGDELVIPSHSAAIR